MADDDIHYFVSWTACWDVRIWMVSTGSEGHERIMLMSV